MINGIIIVHKERDFTSADVVAKLRGICGQRKIGHTGTLDPLATGVLPVCMGNATKLCGMLTDKDKEYETQLLLGVETDTQDITGKILATNTVNVSEEETVKACEAFVGTYEQVPPMYSAIKVNGKRLYELAREGKEIERKARSVTIRELEILELKLPVVRMRIVCSKGTYIRALCADIGQKLGCGGVMKSLRRTRVGDFTLDRALTLGQLQELKDADRLGEAVYPVEDCFLSCPALHVPKEFVRLLENGNAIAPEQTAEKTLYALGEWVRFYRPDESFAGIYAYDGAGGIYRPVKMFLEKE